MDKARKHKKRQLEDTLNLVIKKRKVIAIILHASSLFKAFFSFGRIRNSVIIFNIQVFGVVMGKVFSLIKEVHALKKRKRKRTLISLHFSGYQGYDDFMVMLSTSVDLVDAFSLPPGDKDGGTRIFG